MIVETKHKTESKLKVRLQKAPTKIRGTSLANTVTSITTVTESLPPDFNDKCEPSNTEDS